MADFVPITHGIEVRLRGVYRSSRELINIFNFRSVDVLPGAAEVQELTELVASWVGLQYSSVYSSAVTADSARGRSLAQEPGPFWLTGGINETGGATGDYLPASQTCVVTWHTGMTGSGQHRLFNAWPASEAQQTNGIFTSTYVDDLLSALDNLTSSAATLGSPMAVASRRHLAMNVIIGRYAKDVPRTLRRRYVDKGS